MHCTRRHFQTFDKTDKTIFPNIRQFVFFLKKPWPLKRKYLYAIKSNKITYLGLLKLLSNNTAQWWSQVILCKLYCMFSLSSLETTLCCIDNSTHTQFSQNWRWSKNGSKENIIKNLRHYDVYSVRELHFSKKKLLVFAFKLRNIWPILLKVKIYKMKMLFSFSIAEASSLKKLVFEKYIFQVSFVFDGWCFQVRNLKKILLEYAENVEKINTLVKTAFLSNQMIYYVKDEKIIKKFFCYFFKKRFQSETTLLHYEKYFSNFLKQNPRRRRKII